MIRDLWRHNRFALIALCVAVLVLGIFGVRTISSTLYWYDPAHQDQRLALWMTPRYVAQSYALPRDVIEEVFFIDPGTEPPRMRIGEIAQRNGISLEALQSRLDNANAAYQAQDDDHIDE